MNIGMWDIIIILVVIFFLGAIINYVRLKKTQDQSVKEKLEKAVNEAQNVNGDTV
jgi:uncharacterized alpha/beta hydrolase family protein